MKRMKFFLDTHDHRSSTFPSELSTEQFAEFFAKYEKACRDEAVVVLRAHVGIEAGRAYCFNMAESADQVKRSSPARVIPMHVAARIPAPQRLPLAVKAPGTTIPGG